MDWRMVPKIDSHIHILPEERRQGFIKYQGQNCTWVDISFVLPEFVELYGIEQTNRILRMFGADRLIFGTDYPEREYELYCSILNRMDFTEEEKKKIAYKNVNSILQEEKSFGRG